MKKFELSALFLSIILVIGFLTTNLINSRNVVTPPSPYKPLTTSEPTAKPYPTSIPDQILIAEKDLTVRLEAIGIDFKVTGGTKYKTDNMAYISIYPTSNLNIHFCWGCQPISDFSLCGDSYGMTGTGNCNSGKIAIAGLVFEKHSYLSNGRIAFISGIYDPKPEGINIDYVSIKTTNGADLTHTEQKIIEGLLPGISQSGL